MTRRERRSASSVVPVDGNGRVLGPAANPQKSQATLSDKDGRVLVGGIDGMHACASDGVPHVPGVGTYGIEG